MSGFLLRDAYVTVHVDDAADVYYGGVFVPHSRNPLQWAGRLDVASVSLPGCGAYAPDPGGYRAYVVFKLREQWWG